jgi:hypothetical protein
VLLVAPGGLESDGAKSVFCLHTGPSRITDHPSVEEARSVPVPCGPECRGVHYVVSTGGGKFVITGTGPPRPPLADELLALYPPAPRPRTRFTADPVWADRSSSAPHAALLLVTLPLLRSGPLLSDPACPAGLICP